MGSSKNSEAKSMESYRASLMKRKEQIGQESKKLSEDRKMCIRDRGRSA